MRDFLASLCCKCDRCYDTTIVELVHAVANADGRGPRVGMLFTSHNSGSCAKVLDALVSVGLATHEEGGIVKLNNLAAECISLAQLYGAMHSPMTHLRFHHLASGCYMCTANKPLLK